MINLLNTKNVSVINGINFQIIQNDKRIHEEVLRIEWKAPEFKLMHLNDLPSIQLALQNIKTSDPGKNLSNYY